MIASIPCSGFSSGQKIPIAVKYFNNSSVEVEQTKISLKRIITYITKPPKKNRKVTTDVIIEKFLSGVSINESLEIECTIAIPKTLNTSIGFCNLIEIKYDLEIEGVVSDCHINPQVHFPITIGNQPIDLNFNQSQSSLPPTFDQLSLRNNFQDERPPSFEEAIKMPKLKLNYQQ
ncbi:hypothetical protein PVAND_006104 [Polypedilum vanderplanki]|uniref:Arrestin C-terminal-like domain-containing protein n=1 Tax=Polypedilum vanderplanki TaxID=319348 RepID=A0A9J6C300_POLVA|nr:hypothetical protein PVAND_006104 [Polypedilum vanderplanki]